MKVQRCLRLNSVPDPDFRYFSNSKAFVLLGNEQNQINFTGLYFIVVLHLPELWSTTLCFISRVKPTYCWLFASNNMYTKYMTK